MADRKISDLASLTSPVTGDQIPIVDISEASNVNKNKSITFGTMFRALPNGTAGSPAIGFLSDTGTSGIFRPAIALRLPANLLPQVFNLARVLLRLSFICSVQIRPIKSSLKTLMPV